MKKAFWGLFLGLLLLFCPLPLNADSIPSLPHVFFGDVTVNGSPAPDGTKISASVNEGNIVKNNQNPVVTKSSSYGITSLPLLVQGNNIPDGAVITFQVTTPSGTAWGGTAAFSAGGGPTRMDMAVQIANPSTGGGGGGGGSASPLLALNGFSTNKPLSINSNGVLKTAVKLQTADGLLSLEISQGTKLLTSSNSALSSINVTPLAAPPQAPEGNVIILAYAFAPDGAKFDPALSLSIAYNSALPSGITENDLYITCFDGTRWQPLDTTVDVLTKTAVAKVSHFSNFALIGKGIEPAPVPTTSMTPALTSTVTSALTPLASPSTTNIQTQSTTESSIHSPAIAATTTDSNLSSPANNSSSTAQDQQFKPLSSWMIILLVVIVIAMILAIVLIAGRNRKK